MAEIATVGLRVDGEGSLVSVQQFGKESERAARQVTQLEEATKRLSRAEQQQAQGSNNAAAARTRAREQAKAYSDALEQQYRMDMARIKEGQMRGFVTPQQARAAGREAATAYNQGLMQAIDTASRTPGVFNGPKGQESYLALAGSIKNVDTQGRRAAVSMNSLRASATAMA